MTAVIIGSIGFLCCFLYDHNSIRLKKSFLHPFFSIGCFLIAVSTGLVIRNCWPRRGSSFFISAVFLAAALLFLGLLIYTLFFALPFDETYVKENHERLAYTEGVYALCRHPGVLWFAGFYFCLAGFLGSGKALRAFWDSYRVEHIVHFFTRTGSCFRKHSVITERISRQLPF